MQLIILVDFAINFDIHRIYTFHTQTISILFSNLYLRTFYFRAEGTNKRYERRVKVY